jgi:hypothetical protein
LICEASHGAGTVPEDPPESNEPTE